MLIFPERDRPPDWRLLSAWPRPSSVNGEPDSDRYQPSAARSSSGPLKVPFAAKTSAPTLIGPTCAARKRRPHDKRRIGSAPSPALDRRNNRRRKAVRLIDKLEWMNTPERKLTVSPWRGKAAVSQTCAMGLSVRDQVMGARGLRPSLRLGRAADAHPEAGITSHTRAVPEKPGRAVANRRQCAARSDLGSNSGCGTALCWLLLQLRCARARRPQILRHRLPRRLAAPP